ncbi:hypothetical protein M011DRAFT_463637, partial [Sporormia fimetaria CBS 119925]
MALSIQVPPRDDDYSPLSSPDGLSPRSFIEADVRFSRGTADPPFRPFSNTLPRSRSPPELQKL